MAQIVSIPPKVNIIAGGDVFVLLFIVPHQIHYAEQMISIWQRNCQPQTCFLFIKYFIIPIKSLDEILDHSLSLRNIPSTIDVYKHTVDFIAKSVSMNDIVFVLTGLESILSFSQPSINITGMYKGYNNNKYYGFEYFDLDSSTSSSIYGIIPAAEYGKSSTYNLQSTATTKRNIILTDNIQINKSVSLHDFYSYYKFYDNNLRQYVEYQCSKSSSSLHTFVGIGQYLHEILTNCNHKNYNTDELFNSMMDPCDESSSFDNLNGIKSLEIIEVVLPYLYQETGNFTGMVQAMNNSIISNSTEYDMNWKNSNNYGEFCSELLNETTEENDAPWFDNDDIIISKSNNNYHIHYVTYASEMTDGLRNLKMSAVKAGVDLKVLGLGTIFSSYTDKLINYHNYLKSFSNKIENDIIILMDAYDVLLFPSIKNISKILHTSATPIIFCAENGIYPEFGAIFMDNYNIIRNNNNRNNNSILFSHKYLNSGCIAGSLSYLLSMFDDIMKMADIIQDDQQLFVRYALENPHLVSIDINHEIFLTTFKSVNDYDIIVNNINHTITAALAMTQCPKEIWVNGVGSNWFKPEFKAPADDNNPPVDPTAPPTSKRFGG
eukprot:gene15704-21256_t